MFFEVGDMVKCIKRGSIYNGRGGKVVKTDHCRLRYTVGFGNLPTATFEHDDLELHVFMGIKTGDTVKIKPDCDLYGLGKDNPKEMYGEVYNTNSTTDSIWVKWANGEKNVYKENDLKVIFEATNMKLDTPPAVPKKCCCEIRVVVNFGCKCEAGQAELAKERA